jgi:hypothetical protein
VDPAPPPITITDPNTTAGTGDLLMRRLAGTCPATLFPEGFFDPVEVGLNESYVPG